MLYNKLLLGAASACLLLIGCSCNPTVDTKAEAEEVKKINDEWIAAIHAKDVDKILTFFATQSVSMQRGEPLFVGLSDIRKNNEAWLSDPLIPSTFKGSVDTTEVASSGDLAWNCGTQSFSYTTPIGPMEFSGKWVTFYKKIDGQWKVIMDAGADIKIMTAPSDSPEVVAELTKIETDWNAAMLNKDVNALNQILADEFAWVDEKDLLTREQIIGEITAGRMNWTAPAVLSDLVIHSYGSVAVVNGKNTVKGTQNGKNISGTYRFVDVFVWRDGRWQCVSTK